MLPAWSNGSDDHQAAMFASRCSCSCDTIEVSSSTRIVRLEINTLNCGSGSECPALAWARSETGVFPGIRPVPSLDARRPVVSERAGRIDDRNSLFPVVLSGPLVESMAELGF